MNAIKLLKVSPTLRADDIKALAEWYRDSLGFEVLFLWGEPAIYAMIRRGSIEFGIGKKEPAFGPISAYAQVEGVEPLYAEWEAHGVKASRVPTVQPYGMKDFDLTDSSGNRICYGE